MSAGNTIIATPKFTQHPFKYAIEGMLHKHFTPNIVKNFRYIFEVELYNKGNKNIKRQLQDEHFICEVHYVNPTTNISQYICDLASWWTEQECQWVLLRGVSDNIVKGTIGSDWKDKDIKVSNEVKQGKYTTRKEVLLK